MAKKENTSRYEYQKDYQKNYWIGLPKSIRANKRYYQLFKTIYDIKTERFKVTYEEIDIWINRKRHLCTEYKKRRDFAEIKCLRTEIKILIKLKELLQVKEGDGQQNAKDSDSPSNRHERKHAQSPEPYFDEVIFTDVKAFFSLPRKKDKFLCLFNFDFHQREPINAPVGWCNPVYWITDKEYFGVKKGTSITKKYQLMHRNCIHPDLYDSHGNPTTCKGCENEVYCNDVKVRYWNSFKRYTAKSEIADHDTWKERKRSLSKSIIKIGVFNKDTLTNEDTNKFPTGIHGICGTKLVRKLVLKNEVLSIIYKRRELKEIKIQEVIEKDKDGIEIEKQEFIDDTETEYTDGFNDEKDYGQETGFTG